jgi:uncharacterized membrane protein (GlpM family)
MVDILYQAIIPFFLSALIVIIIMFIAERYGTKTGGIFGTLPSTIVIAFIFIAINKDVNFASQSASIVPAELGINVIFLFCFSIYVKKSIFQAFVVAIVVWTIFSSILVIINLINIYASITIFFISLIFTFSILEKYIKVHSTKNVKVHYTPKKIAFRGILAGIIIAISVLLSNVGAVISGIFSVFPAILTSTMLIASREHGPEFASGMAKSMILGISSVMCYATIIHFLYPLYGIFWGSIFAYILSILVTLIIFKLRKKIL